jgi:hypothetical protein
MKVVTVAALAAAPIAAATRVLVSLRLCQETTYGCPDP